MVNALTLDQKQDLGGYLTHFFATLDQGLVFDESQSFWHSFAVHIKWIGLIWICGLSIIGIPIVLLLNFLKGVLIGFTVSFLVGEYSWKGLWFALLSIAPQNIIIIPTIVISSVAAVAFSLQMVKVKFGQRQGELSRMFFHYCTVTAGMIILLMGISVYEAYLSPAVMKWASPWLLVMS